MIKEFLHHISFILYILMINLSNFSLNFNLLIINKNVIELRNGREASAIS